MNKKRRRWTNAATVTVTILGAVCLSAPALSQVKFSELDARLGRQIVNGQAHSGRSGASSRADSIVNNPQAVEANLDQRLAQLRAQVTVALSRHMLSAYQAADFNAQLNLVQSRETRARRLGLTASGAHDLLGRIRNIESNISVELRPLVKVGNRSVTTRPVTSLDNLENRRLYLQARVQQGIKLGQLSDKQASSFRRQLAEVGKIEQQPGGLTVREQAELRRTLAQIAARLSRFM